jgi:pimeloyl-ACP methyl ester carboxylesterase
MSENLLQDRYVKVGNINTRFWTAGNKGPSVLLIHGAGGSVENWLPNIGAFTEEYRIYALDLPGFGRSDKPSIPYSVPYLAEFVPDFLAVHGVERAHIVGHSMGGAIALQMAFSRPNMLDKLVLVDALGFGTRAHVALRLMALPFIGERMIRPSRKGTKNLFKTAFFNPAVLTEEMIDFVIETAGLPGYGEAFLSAGRSFSSVWGVKRKFVQSIVDNARRLRCPTLVIWGKQDKLLPVEHAHVADSVIANAKLQLFDACGHLPQLEHPEAFNSTVLRFLAG